MKLLLDTHIWLWSELEPERVPLAIRAQLDEQGNEIYLSAVSIWEAVQLVEKQRIRLDDLPGMVAALRAAGRIRILPVTAEIALCMRQSQLAHKDPADRLLVATARVHALKLVTVDRRLAGL